MADQNGFKMEQTRDDVDVKMTPQERAWHWQERYAVRDPEEAYRKQVLKITKQLSFTEWNRRKKESSDTSLNFKNEEEDDAEKRARSEESFLQWVKSKRQTKKPVEKEKSKQKKNEPYVKPPSLHVNVPQKKTESEMVKRVKPKTETSRSRGKNVNAAYDEWLQRKKKETRVKKHQALLEEEIRQREERLRHVMQWQKKDIVCAYSTNGPLRKVSGFLFAA
ncbi:hypothetical protein Poli38472_002172 [Pythium oligandrum]|uniref:Uncharacterized protein n=1 Tax=Pythium oligandrum TaxID=41045 RepID=A0A8K1CGR3_PYTOL|nr:hypothetical protein Poli38472_002172 [Pythium oligandrum]|eukprot:TMW63231.1 hypothetical protein Poli38472_002172 [Pythium oligandrum]